MDLRGKASLLLLLSACSLYAQETQGLQRDLNGFTRAALYMGCGTGRNDDSYVSGIYSDIGLKTSAGNGVNFKAYTDLRFRYGTEFSEQVSYLQLKEAYIRIYGKKWDFTAGQQVIKWGRADFTNPTSKLNPRNYISRSPDREDMDLGNIAAAVAWSPAEFLSLKVVLLPAYRPSVLVTGPVKLPAYVSLEQNSSLISGNKMLSAALRGDFVLESADIGLSWFNGYDPMPGIALDRYRLDLSGHLPDFSMALSEKPYRINMYGADFEFTAGPAGLRGEAAITWPYLSALHNEYVPFPELKWVVGFDRQAGNWSFLAEYSGKMIFGYKAAQVKPLIGTETDLSEFAALMQTPGFDPGKYLEEQVAAFNRLMNCQLDRYSHSLGARAEAELLSAKILPSAFCMYNFTTRDILVMAELRYKPSDGLTLTLGGERYHGRKGSLYDIIDDFMNCIYLGARVDF